MEHRRVLPIAVREKKAKLPPELLEEIKPLKKARPFRFLFELAYSWIVIVSVIAVAVYFDHWLATVLAILIIATRQTVLALLVHEQAHCTGLKAHPGDVIVNLLAAYPLLFLKVEGYTQIHLAHHAKYFTD